MVQDRNLFRIESNLIGARQTIQAFLITSELALTLYVLSAEVPPARLGVSFTPRGEPEENIKSAFAPVDGVWNRSEQGSDQPIALMELKPPHKLAMEALQTALDDGHGRA